MNFSEIFPKRIIDIIVTFKTKGYKERLADSEFSEALAKEIQKMGRYGKPFLKNKRKL